MTRKHLGEGHHGGGPEVGYGEPDDGQDYVDRSHLDFDPADGLLSGTALPHEHHHYVPGEVPGEVPGDMPGEAPAAAPPTDGQADDLDSAESP